MARFTLNVRLFGDDYSETFTNEADAIYATDLIRRINPAAHCSVNREVPPLQGWYPDGADIMALTLMRAGHVIAGIKFVRTKSGASLKEAKDWFEAHFPKPAE